MTPVQVRARMDAALDGELSAEEQADFERALAADTSLREEYEDLTRLLAETRSLGARPEAQGVDLLSGVQQRLRERSGGKFYRDRFAEALGTRAGKRTGANSTTWMLVLALIVVVAVSAWLAFEAGMLAPPSVAP